MKMPRKIEAAILKFIAHHLDDDDITEVLYHKKQVAVIWTVWCVLGECSRLTKEQAWEVLKVAKIREHDEWGMGINVSAIKSHAEDLYPTSDRKEIEDDIQL